MSSRSVLRRGLGFYTSNGSIEPLGAVIRYLGNEIVDHHVRFNKIREQDAGREYPLPLRLRAVRHGVSAHTYRWLGFEGADIDQYLASVAPVRDVNAGHITPIHNKFTFHLQ